MRDEPNLTEYPSNAGLKVDGSKKPGPIDPDLRAIKSIVDVDDAQKAIKRLAPTQAEENLQTIEGHARASEQPRQKKSPAQWLLKLVVSFLRRPDAPRILSFLLLLTILVLEPGFVVFLFVMGLLIGLVLFFSFGPDRVQNWVMNRYRRLRERDPDAAERIRRRAAGASTRLSALVDKLPERWTTGLYLPDFEEPAELPEKWKSDPFEQLANQ
ncbi:hypothetical protein ROG8370_03901 [Roseovarius gaetbuli]|uniref:Uncharacterized protein n=1 Tax=Roseovarius gaetbuli TaxID=1356575 RepID=A0A1X7ADE3_9RHOB|nr:hypothetical protein [Roseovarius gaetbuli]SLN76679.1 hypothetical protein ROG8370_03901 [Roseovarius gaetbuli]